MITKSQYAQLVIIVSTRNSSKDETANVNFLYTASNNCK